MLGAIDTLQPFLQGPGEDSDPGVEVKGLLKYLDYGSGKERGVRK